ncbi:unnamed protein product [Clavelina lepadiformis]|uniref:STAS domain-containing protein n=1 Tax=Clavelina lepadiformis TaxID=159417 RepID=A0ABP0EZ76_CLALP
MHNNTVTEYEFREEFDYHAPEEKPLKVKVKEAVSCTPSRCRKFIFGFLPILTWLPNYSVKQYLPGDIIGGVTTAIVRIPQSLAYGLLAGVDPINGMYTAFFSPLVYTFLGTSKHVSVGTFAVVSLMMGSALDKYLAANPYQGMVSNATIETTMGTTTAATELSTDTGEAMYKLAIISSLTLLVGLMQIIMGALNLGFIALFLSDPLVAGYTTGAALFVFTAQVKYFFGINLHRHQAPFALVKTYIELFTRITETQPAEVIISVLTIVLLYPVKLINIKYKKQLRSIPIPMELIIVIIATIVSANVDLKALYGVEVVGTIPSGLPAPDVPNVSTWPSLIADAFSISIVSFAITVSVGKLFAKRHGYKIAPNQELLALGISQLSCAFFQGHACSGSLARSSVKESSGTKTQFSDIPSCVVIVLVLLFIGPMLSPLPVACLSSIIIVNIRTLFNQFFDLPRLWRLCKFDFAVWVLTFTAVALLGVDLGLAVGVLGLLVTVVLRVYHPSVTVRGVLGNTELYRDVDKFTKADEVEGVKIVRFPQSPFFGNKNVLEQVCASLLTAHKRCEERAERARSRQQNDCEQSRPLLDQDSSENEQASSPEKITNGKIINGKASNGCSLDDYVLVIDPHTGNAAFGDAKQVIDKQTDASVTPQSSSVSSLGEIGLNKEHCFHTVIFDCSGWTFIDIMGMEIVKQICNELKSVKLRVFLAGLQPPVFEKLTKVGVLNEEDGIAIPFPTVRFAVQAALNRNM